jgi:hypothetical protein
MVGYCVIGKRLAGARSAGRPLGTIGPYMWLMIVRTYCPLYGGLGPARRWAGFHAAAERAASSAPLTATSRLATYALLRVARVGLQACHESKMPPRVLEDV